MYESLWSFPGGVMGDFDRLRRELDDVFGTSGLASSIRSVAPGAFPAVNVGHTPTSVEVYAFAPGMDPTKIDVVIDRGVLTISGERASALPPGPGVHERTAPRHSQQRREPTEVQGRRQALATEDLRY